MSRRNISEHKKIQAKEVFGLIVDGQTESWYIQQLKSHKKDISVDLQPRLPQKKKIKELYELVEKLEKEEYSKIFWIVDLDTIIKNSRKSRKGKQTELDEFKGYYNKLSTNKKVIIIINNPCLEYWFLQHFVRTSKYFNNYKELEKDLERYIKGYEKTQNFYFNCNGGKGIYSLLEPSLETAILNSKKLKKFDEANVEDYKTGMAEMYKLFNELKIK